tara:strand:- start:38152 stop:38826 length:675 start_codon:yes stop_codon:yes gene_type:complete
MQLQQRSLFDEIETQVIETGNRATVVSESRTAASVYVDAYKVSSHLFVTPETPLDVLHSFAESINLPGSAYKTKGAIPHYELTKRQRDKAIAQGAMHCDEAGVEAMTQAWRLPPIYITLSIDPIIRIQKDVRRTLGFRDLQPGALMKAGVRIEGQLSIAIKVIRVDSVRSEPLSKMIHDPEYGQLEATREGYPRMTGEQFVKCFCKKYKVVPATPVTRIVFRYV